MTYPDKLEIIPLKRSPNATIQVPGSKSITNRALVLAALNGHGNDCVIRGALQSEDTEVMIQCLKKLGFTVSEHFEGQESGIKVGCDEGWETIPAVSADMFVANSGTTMRFVTALVSLGRGIYRLDGVPRMRERPVEDLLIALRQLGVQATSAKGNGCPPVTIKTTGLGGGRVRVKGDISSQFLSALLMAAPHARSDVTIEINGPMVSWPYVSMTIEMLKHWGYSIHVHDGQRFVIPAPQRRGIASFQVEPDASAASYFFGAAAITKGSLQLTGLTGQSIQGDFRFVELLEEMGCKVVRGHSSTTVSGSALRGIDVDMNDISDTVMTLAAVACFAEGPTTIRNVAHIRHKETDRLAALATELRRVGAEGDEFKDGLTITPRPLHGAEIETYNDHRIAMSMALIGLRVPGIIIKNPGCVAKTYPGFWQDLEKLRG